MIRRLLPLVLLCSSAHAEPVKLGRKPSPVGTTCSDDKRMTVTIPGAGERTPHTTKTYEVLAIANDVVSKVKVTYTTNTDGEAVIGHAYVVAYDGTALSVTRADGKPVSDAERKLVERDNKKLGRADGFEEALVGIPFERGKPVAIPSARLAQWDAFPQPISATLTLQDTRGAASQFKVVIDAGGGAGGDKFAVTGTAVIERATGRTLSLDAEGTFTAGGASGKLHLVASESCKAK